MKRTVFFLILLISLSFHARAQSVRKKAWVVNNAGDTMVGWVEHKNWRKNPASIQFYPDSLSRTSSTYNTDDIQSLNVLEYEKYVRAIVTKDNRPVNAPYLLNKQEELNSTDTLLLKKLVYGGEVELSLYRDTKDHFYIRTRRGYEELTYKVSLSKSGLFIERVYLKQLKQLLGNELLSSATLMNQIDRAEYKETDLVRVIKKINEAKGSDYQEDELSSKLLTQFFIGAGGGYSTLHSRGGFSDFGEMKFSGGFVPFATVGFDFSAARKFQDWIFRVELAYTSASYKGSGLRKLHAGASEYYTTSYELQQTNISPSVSFLYNVVRKDRHKVYLGIGGTYNFAFYGKNRYSRVSRVWEEESWDNYLDHRNGWLGFQGKLGYKFADKWEIGLNSLVWGVFTKHSDFSFSPNTHTAQLRYFF